jgi:hypothetical protein
MLEAGIHDIPSKFIFTEDDAIDLERLNRNLPKILEIKKSYE